MGEQRKFWEPWTPTVGQRTRVRIRFECQMHVENHHESALIGADGREGYVEATDHAGWPGHPIKIYFCEPFKARHLSGMLRVVIGGVFAASELEPVDV